MTGEFIGAGKAQSHSLAPSPPQPKPLRLAVLVSGKGRGTNLQAILDGCADGRILGRVAVAISTTRGAPALERARAAGVETLEMPARQGEAAPNLDEAIRDALLERQVDLVCLAGYMRLVGRPLLAAFPNRILSIHPALIPAFCGPGLYGHHVHEAVIAYGAKVSGCTVFLVNEAYDEGPILLQTCVPVEEDDTPDTLAARVLAAEHGTYVRALALFAQGRVRVEGRHVRVLPVAGA